MSERMYKRDVPLTLTAILAIVVSLEYFLDIKLLTDIRSNLVNFVVIVGAIGVYYGIYFLMRMNFTAVIQRKDNWMPALAYFAGFALVLGIGILSGTGSDNYLYVIKNTVAVSAPALNAVSFFSLVMAAYRSFRLKSWEPIIMMAAGVIVLLRVLPIGTAVFPPLAGIGDWITLVPNKGAARGAILCGALGAIIMAIRAFGRKEQSIMGS